MRPGRRSYIVVDASVSLKWVLDDEDCVDSATALRDDGLRGRFRMVVPSLWHYEITNGVLVAVRRGRLPSSDGAQAVSSLLDLGLQSIELKMDGCYQIADRYNGRYIPRDEGLPSRDGRFGSPQAPPIPAPGLHLKDKEIR